MKTIKLILIFLVFASGAQAEIFVGKANSAKSVKAISAGCSPAKNSSTMELNNVRTRITTASDMWWDNNNSPRYEVPKNSGKHVLFAASLWLAGIDAAGQLKVAAVRYRQDGNDFWPGPLNMQTADIDAATCNEWDKHFKIKRSDVEEFVAYQSDKNSFPNYSIPASITKWPGNGDAAKGQTNFLAPFYDADGDGRYNPGAGDYPKYDVSQTSTGGSCSDFLFGDETLWWVFNDKGNIHTESGAEAIGVEIHAQAFAFNTTDDINNMTFYNFKLFNRSSITLNDTYLGWNVDGDLGDATDDYVGCDVNRGFGYFYNGDNADGNGNGNTYGAIPPAVGIDFFQGPLADPGDGIDNNRNGIIDEVNEQIIMSKFVYYSNNGTPYGDPQQANEYYNYLKGFWRNNTPMTYGGNGQNPSGVPCNFMFPWDTDAANGNVMWSENGPPAQPPGDRRFVQSCGTFTLKPGAVNNVTVGAVYARATTGNERDSRKLLLAADDIAQGLFDDCFKPIDGPDAPDVLVRESDKQIILLLSNKTTSNNFANSYDRWDRSISSFMNAKTVAGVRPILDSTFSFEGYQIYQLKNASVSITDVDNPDLARLIKISDAKNGVTKIVNYEFDVTTNSYIAKVKTEGSDLDQGLESSFAITTDAFNSGGPLVNFKSYYFIVVAYAYNNFLQYKSDVPYSNAFTPSYEGQKLPFLRGRRNIRVVTAIPSVGVGITNGSAAQAAFGLQPQVTRVEGQGNGGGNIALTKETIEEILKNGKAQNLVYERGAAPIKVKVVDPLNIQEADFQFKLLPVTDDSLALDTGKTKWSLTNLVTGEIVKSEGTILYQNEQVIEKWGISINAVQVAFPATSKSIGSGILTSSVTENDWLNLVSDNETNWIFSDQSANPNYANIDPRFNFQSIAGGTVAPYRLLGTGKVLTFTPGPGLAWKDSLSVANRDSLYKLNSLENLEDVEIVFTSDKSKWTRSAVLEMCDDTILAVGRAKKMSLRKSPSVDKDGNAESGSTGMGWFPGFAINRSTGERLNIAFGENSRLKTDNGADMKWNPSSRSTTPIFDVVGGGVHTIYIFGHNSSADDRMPAYDQGAYIKSKLDRFEELWAQSLSVVGAARTQLQTEAYYNKRLVYRDAMWTLLPLLKEGGTLLSSDVTVKVGMARPFRKMLATSPFTSFTVTEPNAPSAAAPINNNYSVFTFSTKDLKPILNNDQLKADALTLINVVPNPYYAYSAYENGVIDNRVRITNLPKTCNITIYTNNGTIVRKFSKDSPQTYLDWDLKNTINIPVASGLYLIHVDVEGVGSRTLKFMGVMRQLDLETF